MTTIDLTPGSPEWCRRISPSKAAAILGISPWDSPYAIWRKMRGDVPWDEETEPMERGNLLEAGVLAWWRKHHDHTAWREQVSLTVGDWMVATPDGLCVVDGEPVVVEAKTTSSDDDWGDAGTDAIPAYYLAQGYLTGRVCWLNGIQVKRIEFPVLGPRLRFTNYVMTYDDALGADIEARMREFYSTLAVDTAPPLDDTVATYDAVRKVHADIDRGESVELDAEAAWMLAHSAAEEKAAKDVARYWRSHAIEQMGRAQYLTHNGVRLARRQPHGDDVRFVVIAKTSDLSDLEGSAA